MTTRQRAGATRRVKGDLASWREVLSDVFVELDIEMLEAGPVATSQMYPRPFGDLTFIRSFTRGCRHRVVRSEEAIARSQHRNFFIGLLVSGEAELRQHARRAILYPGDIVVFDSMQQYSLELPRRFEALWVGVPRYRLEARLPRLMEVMAQKLDGSQGIGHVASVMLKAAFRESGDMDPTSANRVANTFLDLISQALLIETEQGPRHSRYHNAIVQRIRDFIEARLEDDRLTVASIAAHHNISARYLSKLFEEEGVGVARWIRLRRLERSRTMLEDHGDQRGVAEIAFACGFGNVSAFNRAFKQTYNSTPGSLRNRAD